MASQTGAYIYIYIFFLNPFGRCQASLFNWHPGWTQLGLKADTPMHLQRRLRFSLDTPRSWPWLSLWGWCVRSFVYAFQVGKKNGGALFGTSHVSCSLFFSVPSTGQLYPNVSTSTTWLGKKMAQLNLSCFLIALAWFPRDSHHGNIHACTHACMHTYRFTHICVHVHVHRYF